MFEVEWGLALQGGAVVPASAPGTLICPCCRHLLTRTPDGQRLLHPTSATCSPPQLRHALARRAALAALCSPRPPELRERCVCCTEPTETPVGLTGGGPGGGDVVWSRPGLTVCLGTPAAGAALAALWLSPGEVLRGRWWAVPRRKCAPCAASDAGWVGAQRAWLRAQHPWEVAS